MTERFTPEQIRTASQRIADCLELANRALEEAQRTADTYTIDFVYHPRIAQNYAVPDTLYYRPERFWINSDHQCKSEQYDGREYGWSQTEAEPLIEVDPHEYLNRY
jgi:hypothetical protein